MPSNCYWRGDSPAINQVNTVVVGGTAAAGQVYSVTINGKTVSYTALVSDANADIATALQVALNASTITEFTEVVWTVDTLTITGTAATAGLSFTNTSSATGTGTLVTSTTTANSGPNLWSVAANWSNGAVPITGDSVYLRNSNVDIREGLAQSGVTLALLDIDSTYTGKIGLPDFNAPTGQSGYYEYRNTYLAIGATTLNVGRGYGAGSTQLRINTGSVQTALNVLGTSSPALDGGYALEFLGTHASNALVVSRGSVGIANKPGTSATLLTAKIGTQANALSDVSLLFGDGVTLGTVNMNGGTVQTSCSVTTVTTTDGVLTVTGSAAVTTLNADGGTINYDSSGTLGTYRGGTKSLIDFSRVNVTRTVTNTTLEATAGLLDPLKTVTFTNPLAIRCKLSELGAFDLGEQFNLQRS